MTDNHRPHLNANLLEGLMAECISQIKLSLDCCHNWKEGSLTLIQNIAATKVIARDEIWNVVDVTQYHTRKGTRPKQWLFMERCRRYLREEKAIELTADSEESADHATALKMIIKLLGDAHLILHENTPENIREYLTYGGEIKELKKRGNIYKAPLRLASKRKIAKRSGGKSEQGTPGNDSSRVRERGESLGASVTARNNRQNNTSLERIGGLASLDDTDIGSDSGASEEPDSAEGGEFGSRSDSGDRGSAGAAQGDHADADGYDAGGSSESDGISPRGSVQAASGDQGGLGDHSERVGFGPENMGLGRPGEDFDDGYLRSIERHRKLSGAESSAHRGEVLAMKNDLAEMIEGLQLAVADLDRFEGGNDAAGRRVRKVCAEIAKSCKGIRASVQEVRNSRKG